MKLKGFESNTIVKTHQKQNLAEYLSRAMDSINNSIQNKNQKSFHKEYITLTNLCNTCHKETKHECNVIKILGNHTL